MNLLLYYGVSPQYIGTVESGENCLSIEKIILLAEKAKVSTDYILLGKNNTIEDELLRDLNDITEEQLDSYFSVIKQIIISMKKSYSQF